jgi:glycosyltransferase
MKISIITVTKNNKPGLMRAIECVRNQTYKNIEHIIIDGGSTDGTVDMLRQAQNDSLLTTNLPTGQAGYSLTTISEPDDGIYDAINKGIKLATGDVIGLLHSDDLFADEKVLEKYAEAFGTDSRQDGMTGRIEAVYSDLVYVSQKTGVRSQELEGGNSTTTNYSLLTSNYSVIRYWKTHKSSISNESSVSNKNADHRLLVTDHLLKNGWMPPHPTLFISKEIFDKYGLYRTDMKIAADYEMILRLLYKHRISAHYLPVTTYIMTIGGASNKSVGNIIQKSKEDYLAMKMNGINFPILTLIRKNLRKLPQFLARDLS